MVTQAKLILLTNDDGIDSPGLWAAAAALAPLGQVMVVAPLSQCTSAGRSMPPTYTGRIETRQIALNGHTSTAYAVEATPALAVQHALLEIVPRLPDLVVAGINYGENIGSGVTISGTVGAALEAASWGIPALAVSLETHPQYHYSHSGEVDFSAAAHFTQLFARQMLENKLPPDVDVLKIEVPEQATVETPWQITRQSRTRYYFPLKSNRVRLEDPGPLGYEARLEPDRLEPDSDVQVLTSGRVAVTPLSLDLTSRVDLGELGQLLGQTH